MTVIEKKIKDAKKWARKKGHAVAVMFDHALDEYFLQELKTTGNRFDPHCDIVMVVYPNDHKRQKS